MGENRGFLQSEGRLDGKPLFIIANISPIAVTVSVICAAKLAFNAHLDARDSL